MKVLYLIFFYLKIGLLNELQYRENFLIQIIESGFELLISLVGIRLVFSQTSSLNGWSSHELLLLVGIYFLMGGYTNLMIQPSFQRFIEDIRKGDLDFILTKPQDAQLLVSIRQVNIWRLVDVALGASLIYYAAYNLNLHLSIINLLLFISFLACGALIIYGFLLILSTTAFWLIRIENILVIYLSMYEAGRWPVHIYPAWLRFSLTFVVPIAFAVTIPAEVMVGRWNWNSLLITASVAAGLLIFSRWFWKKGVSRYSSASS